MRPEVTKELKARIERLERNAKSMDIETGMSGSMLRFEMYLDTQTAMTEKEFHDGVYDKWLQDEHSRIYNKINNVQKDNEKKILKTIFYTLLLSLPSIAMHHFFFERVAGDLAGAGI